VQSFGQTLIYLLIALPVVYGVYWRYKTRASIPRAMYVTALVFGMVALGLVIYHYNDKEHPLEAYRGFGTVESAVAQWLGGPKAATEPAHHQPAPRGAHDPIARVKERAAQLADRTNRAYARFLTAGLLVVFFCGVGAVMGLMGPILAGYTLTMALSSYFHGGSFEEIPLWRAFFEFFSVNSAVMQLCCLIGASVLSVGDSMLAGLQRQVAPPVG
jgi:uncharacterized membrane protein